MLNATEISATERRGAEYDYLKKYGLEWLAVKDTEKRDEFLEEHNRYLELIESKIYNFPHNTNFFTNINFTVYGAVDENELKILSNTINSSLVSVEIQHENKIVTKKLPRSILVQKLIMLVQKLFRLTERPKLKYVSGLQPEVEIELDDECKEFSFYSVQDGDRIIAIL